MRVRACIAVALCALTLPARALEPSRWALVTIAPEGSPAERTVQDTIRTIEQAAGGRLRIRPRMGGEVADESTTLELCRKGTAQMWAGSLGAVAAVVPELAVLETPYLFRDAGAFAAALRTDFLRSPKLLAALRARGLEPFGISFLGWRAMSSRTRPVRTPADLKGLRVRAQPAPLHRAMWKLLGALPRETSLAEIQPLFQQGEVEATDLPALYVYATSIAPFIKFHTRTDHMMQTGISLMNLGSFNALPKATQAAIIARRLEASQRATRFHEAFEDELQELMRRAGVQMLPLSSEEKEPWQRALAPLRAEAIRLSGAAGPEVLRRIEQGR